jgi:hypothetical protein
MKMTTTYFYGHTLEKDMNTFYHTDLLALCRPFVLAQVTVNNSSRHGLSRQYQIKARMARALGSRG